jgi:hypothetical protein
MKRLITSTLLNASKWGSRLFLCLGCLLSVAPVTPARATDFGRRGDSAGVQNAHAARTPDSQFAIGDFDGDRQPDLATVEITRFSALRSRYSISFRLSKGGLETVGVTAPAGGLALFAQDVNGDRALDVVLVTAWRHELVAVLLNDGKGNFLAADPHQFEISAVSSGTQIGRARILEDRTVLSFPYSALRSPSRRIAAAPEWQAAFSLAPGFLVTLFPSSFSSRAPPRYFFHA